MRNRAIRVGAWALAGVLGLIVGPAARAADVKAEMVEIKGGAGPIKAYLAAPTDGKAHPAIVVIHEWWGLTDWVKENARRLAETGYVALAVDLYGGKATSDLGEAHELMRALNHKEAVADLKGGVAYLKGLAGVDKTAKVGAIGWCMGGGLARELAQASDDVGPFVICYGAVTADAEELDKLKGKPLLGLFGEDDKGIPAARVKQFAAALKDRGSPVELHIYPKAGHGFMRSGHAGHSEKAAADAWKEIDKFFAVAFKRDK